MRKRRSYYLLSLCKALLFFAWVIEPRLAQAQERPMMELSAQQGQFEQRMTDRIFLALDPMLGRENYSLNIDLTTRRPQSVKDQQFSFTKLGITRSLPTSANYDTFKFSDWVSDAEIRLAYSAHLKDIDENLVKSTVENSIKGLGKFKYTVLVSTFTPAKLSALARPISTSWSIMGGGTLVFLAMLWAAWQLRSLSFSFGQAANAQPQAHAGSYYPEYKDPDASRMLASLSQGAATKDPSAKEGLKKWTSWLSTDKESARLFLERLGRSQDRNDNDLMAYILQSTDTTQLREVMKELNKEVVSKARAVISAELDDTLLLKLDQTLTKIVTQEILDQHLDSENILKVIHDFTLEESVLAANKWPNLLALYVRFFPMNRVEQIVAQVDSQAFHDFLHKNETAEIPWARLANEARKFVLQHRQELSTKDNAHSKWIMVASHLDSEREQAFYESMKYHKAVHEVLDYATENFPQFLMESLPEEILKPVLNSYPLNERAEVVHLLQKTDRAFLTNLYQAAPKILDLLTFELDQIKNQEYRAQLIESRSPQITKNFISRLRKFIRSSPDNRSIARNIIVQWGEGGKYGQPSKAA